MVRRDIGLVYGGGTVGLMGVIAHEIAEGLGPNRVLGVIPKALTPREISSDMIGDTRVVDDMHERKAMMARHADAFIAMPGGFGTLEELMEVITWQQLGFHEKPIGLYNVEGFFDPLISFFRHAVGEGFVSRGNVDNLVVSDDAEDLMDRLSGWQPVAKGLLLSAEERKAAIGEDVGQHV